MGKLSVGEVIFLPFPFSNLAKSKLRPAVILANANNDDWILCQVTSNPYFDPLAEVIINPMSRISLYFPELVN